MSEQSMSADVTKAIEQLRTYRDKIYTETKEHFAKSDGTFYTLGFLYLGALNRCACLLRGFCDLMQSKNFLAAAPLIRLQLDNCLRVAALDYVDDRNSFASAVLGGKHINKLRARTTKRAGKKKAQPGELLTDKYLCNELAKTYPWIREVYAETSSFVHLSDKHIFNAMQIQSTEDRTARFKVSDTDEFVPDASYLEALRAFGVITDLFLRLFHSWTNEPRVSTKTW